MQDRVIQFVINHSKIEEETFKELMFAKGNLTRDIGTNVIGKEAVSHGLIDEVGGIKEALAKINELIKENKQDEKGLLQ